MHVIEFPTSAIDVGECAGHVYAGPVGIKVIEKAGHWAWELSSKEWNSHIICCFYHNNNAIFFVEKF